MAKYVTLYTIFKLVYHGINCIPLFCITSDKDICYFLKTISPVKDSVLHTNKNGQFVFLQPTCSVSAEHQPSPHLFPSCNSFHSAPRLSKRGRRAGFLRLRTNKTVCQATLTLHPYRLSDLRHFMGRSCQPPQTPTARRGKLYALLHHQHHCLLDTVII